jgi:4-alpha-glucanotransferase
VLKIVDSALIERLARLRGIGDAYYNYRGELQYFAVDSKLGILRAMGCAVDDDAALAAAAEQLEASQSRRFLPALAAVRGPRALIDVNISARQLGAMLVWSVTLEDGTRREGATSSGDCRELWRGESNGSWITRRQFQLPIDLPPGYHELEIKIGAESSRCLLIASPAQCFELPALTAGQRLWGLAVQLYTLRSRENWGIGDFGDLRLLIRWLAAHGAGFIGLNPLHALSPADPDRSSPYSASSRHFLNVLYIAVPQVAEFAQCRAAQERLQDPRWQQRLTELKAGEHVD